MIRGLNLSDNFSDQVVRLICERQKNPLQTAKTTIILPTKRSCLSVKNAFVKISEKQPILIPQLRALYEMDDLNENLPPALSDMERLFLLARLCQKKPNVSSFDKALKIAQSLADLLDEFYEYEVNPSHLKSLVEEENLAIHWQESLAFLDILIDVWPKILKEKGKIDIADRRVRLIRQLAEKIARSDDDEFYILGGFDDDSPAVKDLIKKIAFKKNVLILLNGLNVYMDKDEEKALNENHYQYPLYSLLKALGKNASDIKLLSEKEQPQEALIREAFKPSDLTDEWLQSDLTSQCVSQVRRIECENLAEEALTIALIMRQVLETPEKTATLVTTDRNLARRVLTEMRRWGIELDDSAGIPLNNKPIGIFLLLLIEYALNPNGNTALALLKHPLSADQRNPTDLRTLIRSEEKKARQEMRKLQVTLNTKMEYLFKIFQSNQPVPFLELLTAHLKAAEELATSTDKSGKERLWETDDGEEAFRFFSELQEQASLIESVLPETYPQVLQFLMHCVSLRPKYGMHPRLDILGPIESRLSHSDVCIIGGLNEGSFPTLPDSGPWLSRQMRKKMNLPSPESVFATQSMDFAACFCAKEVYLTRSLKDDGSQTIPSRFLSRIEAVLSAHHNAAFRPDPIDWKKLKPIISQKMDRPLSFEKIARPAPCPSKELRPKTLSVTRIRDLMTNPYAVYARSVLQLKPLNNLESFNALSGYGSALHAAFQEMMSVSLPSVSQTVQKINEQMRLFGCEETDLRYFKTKIEKSAEFFVNAQLERKDRIKKSMCEVSGSWCFTLHDGTLFTLTGKADRIDQMTDGSYEIIDYKTGSVPTSSSVQKGIDSQLPLEGLILKENGYPDYQDIQEDIHFSYWHINGKGTGGEITTFQETDKCAYIQEAEEGVVKLLNAYQNDTKPYESRLMMKEVKYDDYEHLARVKEWLTEESE